MFRVNLFCSDIVVKLRDNSLVGKAHLDYFYD